MKSVLKLGIIFYFFIKTNSESNHEDESSSQTVGEVELQYPVETSSVSHSQTLKISNTSLSEEPTTAIHSRISIKPVTNSSRRERRRELFDRMVQELSDGDPIKIQKLTTAPDSFYREMNKCFMESYNTFMRFCRLSFMGGGVKYFKLLLSVACESDWLTTERICWTLRQTCQPRIFGHTEN